MIALLCAELMAGSPKLVQARQQPLRVPLPRQEVSAQVMPPPRLASDFLASPVQQPPPQQRAARAPGLPGARAESPSGVVSAVQPARWAASKSPYSPKALARAQRPPPTRLPASAPRLLYLV